jgi:hypothetical protein
VPPHYPAACSIKNTRTRKEFFTPDPDRKQMQLFSEEEIRTPPRLWDFASGSEIKALSAAAHQSWKLSLGFVLSEMVLWSCARRCNAGAGFELSCLYYASSA